MYGKSSRVTESRQNCATSALVIDPASPSMTLITPVGGSTVNPPGRTMQYSKPEFITTFSWLFLSAKIFFIAVIMRILKKKGGLVFAIPRTNRCHNGQAFYIVLLHRVNYIGCSVCKHSISNVGSLTTECNNHAVDLTLKHFCYIGRVSHRSSNKGQVWVGQGIPGFGTPRTLWNFKVGGIPSKCHNTITIFQRLINTLRSQKT
mmetsp:Transcript_24403/g.35677  ORF Transcript_24403/g.35677 Transcript_24403/m.35677 type:complete len:204 (-) Transcript_24403:252-863(-)